MRAIFERKILAFQNWIENHIFEQKNILWFRRCCYTLLLIKMLFIWPDLNIFYNHVTKQHTSLILPHKWMLLPIFNNYYHYYWLMICMIVLYAIISKGSYFLSAIVFIISSNYFLLIHGATNNGDKIMNVFIFMLIFVKYNAKPRSLAQMINNSALIILQLHVCLLYLYNVYGKLIQPTWRDGTYFENVWSLPYHVNNTFLPNFISNPSSYFLTAWSVLLFEFSFPVLIWTKNFNKPLLIIGILFHLSIGLTLSLPYFGLIMIISYILFYKFKENQMTGNVVTLDT